MARSHLPPGELQQFYARRARTCEDGKQWQDAEKAYVAAGEVDMAINMYRVNKMWLPLLKLVQQHRREHLPQMHLLVAQVRRHACAVDRPWARSSHNYRVHQTVCHSLCGSPCVSPPWPTYSTRACHLWYPCTSLPRLKQKFPSVAPADGQLSTRLCHVLLHSSLSCHVQVILAASLVF